ncbi:MAG: phage terminase small subunit-related protein [Eubacteriales bacterium]|nr:phage terminase small subunit-related protein [Eubacteriales bacterium]
MPNRRSPAREIARQLWRDSGGKRPLVSIAAECGVSAGLIRKWKNLDGWTLENKKKSDPDVTGLQANGNGNAEAAKGYGNADGAADGADEKPQKRGGHNPKSNQNLRPAPAGNKRAVTAGEYETILYETLNEPERALAAASVRLSPTENALQSLAVLSVREKRIMERINDRIQLAGGTVTVNGSAMFASRVLNTKAESDEGSRQKQSVEYESVISFVTTLEDALTRVQAAKARVIGLLHKMQKDSVMTDLERRKVEAMERREALEQKRFEFEYGRDGDNADPITGWLDAIRPGADDVEALYSIDDSEGEDES